MSVEVLYQKTGWANIGNMYIFEGQTQSNSKYFTTNDQIRGVRLNNFEPHETSTQIFESIYLN